MFVVFPYVIGSKRILRRAFGQPCLTAACLYAFNVVSTQVGFKIL